MRHFNNIFIFSFMFPYNFTHLQWRVCSSDSAASPILTAPDGSCNGEQKQLLKATATCGLTKRTGQLLLLCSRTNITWRVWFSGWSRGSSVFVAGSAEQRWDFTQRLGTLCSSSSAAVNGEWSSQKFSLITNECAKCFFLRVQDRVLLQLCCLGRVLELTA